MDDESDEGLQQASRPPEQLLIESELRYRRLFETAQDGILILDGDSGAIIDANPFLTDMLGYSHEELLGKQLWEIGAFADIEASKEAFAELRNKGYIRYEDLQLKTRDDRLMDVEFISNRYAVNGGQVYQCNIRDISARVQAEQKVRQLIEERAQESSHRAEDLARQVTYRTQKLETAIKDLESFSYSISHDLRAPLRAIDGFSQILLTEYADKLDDEGQRLIHIVRDNTTKMAKLIDDVLDFSRAGRGDLKLANVDVAALAREVFDEIRADAGERKIRLKISELPPGLADRALLRQVLTNLLSNAVKFTSGRDVAEIELSGAITGNEVMYTLKDNGAGFDPQYSHKLFGVFQRLHSEEEFAGTGIGLAIVKRIIDRHGGQVSAEGTPGQGALIRFSLPRDSTPQQGA